MTSYPSTRWNSGQVLFFWLAFSRALPEGCSNTTFYEEYADGQSTKTRSVSVPIDSVKIDERGQLQQPCLLVLHVEIPPIFLSHIGGAFMATTVVCT
jgi:hypothetical protein